MKFLTVLPVLLYVLGLSSTSSQDCNPLVCLHWFNLLFESKDYLEVCFKLKKMEDCLNSCPFPENNASKIIHRGLSSVRENVCGSSFDFEVSAEEMNECLSEYKHRLLFCGYRALNIQPINPSTDSQLLTCRRILEADQCPEVSLGSCPPNVKKQAMELMANFFLPVRKDVCQNSSFSDVQNVQTITDERYMKYYQKLVKCTDIHHLAISSCLPQKMTTNFLITGHYKTEICNGINVFISCAVQIVSSRCDDEKIANMFKETLRTFIPQYCSPTVSLTNAVSSIPLIPTSISPVIIHYDLPEEESVKVPTDAQVELYQKSSTTQPQSLSNHSVSEIGLFIVHVRDKENSGNVYQGSYTAPFVIILVMPYIFSFNFFNGM